MTVSSSLSLAVLGGAMPGKAGRSKAQQGKGFRGGALNLTRGSGWQGDAGRGRAMHSTAAHTVAIQGFYQEQMKND